MAKLFNETCSKCLSRSVFHNCLAAPCSTFLRQLLMMSFEGYVDVSDAPITEEFLQPDEGFFFRSDLLKTNTEEHAKGMAEQFWTILNHHVPHYVYLNLRTVLINYCVWNCRFHDMRWKCVTTWNPWGQFPWNYSIDSQKTLSGVTWLAPIWINEIECQNY